MLAAPSFRVVIESFVAYWIEFFEGRREETSLTAEISALAAREPWTNKVVLSSIREGLALVSQTLTAARDAGLARDDLDVEAAAALLLAGVEGVGVLCMVGPGLINSSGHAKTWADMIEFFIVSDSSGDLDAFRRCLGALVLRGVPASGEVEPD